MTGVEEGGREVDKLSCTRETEGRLDLLESELCCIAAGTGCHMGEGSILLCEKGLRKAGKRKKVDVQGVAEWV